MNNGKRGMRGVGERDESGHAGLHRPSKGGYGFYSRCNREPLHDSGLCSLRKTKSEVTTKSDEGKTKGLNNEEQVRTYSCREWGRPLAGEPQEGTSLC